MDVDWCWIMWIGVGVVCVTWWLSGAGLQGAGLFGHRFGEGVTPSDQLSALITLHVPHPDANAARLRALRRNTRLNRQEEQVT